MPEVSALTPEQVTAIANAGPGPLADLARAARAAFALDEDQARNYGAGFVSDLLRMNKDALPEPVSAAIENIANANPANIKVSAADWPSFPVGTIVTFANTGFAALDEAEGPLTVASVNEVGKTFKVAVDLSGEAAPGSGGTVTTVPQPSVEQKTGEAAAATILTDPPPLPAEQEPAVPNGYEQAAADEKAAKETA